MTGTDPATLHRVFLGVASQTITPDAGCQLSGFIARVEPMTGVHDELLVKAMVWAEDAALANAAVLITFDLIELDRDEIGLIRDAVAAACGIPGDRVGITCTHTHGGPATMTGRRLGNVASGYLERVCRIVAETVETAARALAPVFM
ncbi:MAG: hypothetical protein ACRDHN_12955, partial [Thermomicrobiales bacterium]